MGTGFHDANGRRRSVPHRACRTSNSTGLAAIIHVSLGCPGAGPREQCSHVLGDPRSPSATGVTSCTRLCIALAVLLRGVLGRPPGPAGEPRDGRHEVHCVAIRLAMHAGRGRRLRSCSIAPLFFRSPHPAGGGAMTPSAARCASARSVDARRRGMLPGVRWKPRASGPVDELTP